MSYESQTVAAEVKQAHTLIGGTIEGVLTTPEGTSFGLLVIKRDQRLNVWVDLDPEGNGPGHLNLEPAN
jgi:hypothetical protein